MSNLWKKLKGTLKGNTGEDGNSIISRRHSSASEVSRPTRQRSLEFPPESYTVQAKKAAFETLRIEVTVFRQGHGNFGAEESYALPCSRLLVPGMERHTHLSQSYSYRKFVELFEIKMDQKHPKQPLEIAYGRVGYFDHRGDHKKVGNQDEFEIAINHLYLDRGSGDVLKFIFQPEPEDETIKRLAKAADPRSAGAGAVAVADPRSNEDDPLLQLHLPRSILGTQLPGPYQRVDHWSRIYHSQEIH